MRSLRCIFIVLAALMEAMSLLSAQEDREPAPDSDPITERLVHGFVKQAKQLESAIQRTGSDVSFIKLKEEIEIKRKAWESRIEHDLGAGKVLAGISLSYSAIAADSAEELEDVKSELKVGATLPKVLTLAARRNPELRVAFENLQAATRRFEQAAYLEELVAQYKSFVRELDTKVGPQSHKEMPEKTFAFPAALALKGQIVDLEVELARLRFLEALRKAINGTAKGFFDIQYAEQKIAILKENRELFAKMDSIATEQLKVGRAGQADSLKAQSELAMIETQVTTAERERINAAARVNALLGLAPDTSWGALTPCDLSDSETAIAEALTIAHAENQSFLRSDRDVELMETMLRMAETEVLPRGSQGASRLSSSTGAEAGPTRKEMAAFPPMKSPETERAGFGANAAYLDELRVRVQEAKRMRDATRAMTEFMVKDAHFMVDAMRRERKTFAENVVPKSKLALETVRERYNTATVPFIEYLDAARSYLNNSLELEKARKEHNRALVDLQDAIGRSALDLIPKTREEGKKP